MKKLLVVAVYLATLGAACSAGSTTSDDPGPKKDEPSTPAEQQKAQGLDYEITVGDFNPGGTYVALEVTLPGGRVIPCISWKQRTGEGKNAVGYGGLDCDWTAK
jgi:hypothetical protein